MPSSPRRVLIGPDFEGLAGFILFLLILVVVIIWVVYKLATIIVPATIIVLFGLVVLFVPYHHWEKATIETRSERQIERCLREIRVMESAGVSREQVFPLERRVRESAQAMADAAYARFQRVSKKTERCKSRVARHQESTSDFRARRSEADLRRQREQQRRLARTLERVRMEHDVVPESDGWRRFFFLHLQRDWVRWMVDHPRPARYIIALTLMVLITTVASTLNQGFS